MGAIESDDYILAAAERGAVLLWDCERELMRIFGADLEAKLVKKQHRQAPTRVGRTAFALCVHSCEL